MLLKSATGPPPKRDTDSASQVNVPEESPYFPVATQVAKATSDFDMNRTLTAADMGRQIGHRRLEAQRTNPQFSLSTTLKLFGTAAYVRFLALQFPILNLLARPFHQSVIRHC
jgi:hypothetical protein